MVRATEQLAASPDRPHFHRYRALMILFGLYHADAPEDGGTVYIRSGLAPDNPRADRYYAQARELYVQGIEQKLAAALDARGLRFANGLDDYRLRIPQPLANTTLCVKTGLRIELDSCVGNDHVLVAQDIGATIIHVSILLRDAESGRHDYPIRVHVRRLPEPVLRLGSIDKAVPPTDITSVTEVFSLAPVGAGEWIRLSKAAVVAAGIVPPSLRGRPDAPPLAAFLERLGGGLEIVTDVRGVPVGSGTGTSSAIAAALVAALVKFTGQSRAPLTAMPDDERMLVIARVLLVEQLIGALGGWQDPCVIFPGIKLLTAAPGDFLPAYRPLEVSPAARAELVRRLQLTDGCYRQPSQAAAWQFTGLWVMRLASVYEARMRTRRLVQEQIANLEGGTIERMGPVESADWLNRCAISPKATNPYIERVVELVRQALAPARVDFDASGARGGAGGCFWIDPDDVPAADFADAFDRACRTAMDECRGRIRFEGEPHLYDYAINDRGMEIGLE
ncbi:MAG: hypothetical protein BWZ02_00126 [Lentisphaerae bacterium ADurb.BinA184]|nr:MAG: hypothetical protein BWZ02_00126 [Lentisphaerae bacterium ADurb.BinA184]